MTHSVSRIIDNQTIHCFSYLTDDPLYFMYINQTCYVHIKIIGVGCDDDHIALMLIIRAILFNDPQCNLYIADDPLYFYIN